MTNKSENLEVRVNQEGDEYILHGYEEPKTEEGRNFLTDNIENNTEVYLKKVAMEFGLEIKEIESLDIIKELSEIAVRKLEERFQIFSDRGITDNIYQK